MVTGLRLSVALCLLIFPALLALTWLLEIPALVIITLYPSWGRKEKAELFCAISLEGRGPAHLTFLFPAENEQPASLDSQASWAVL